MKLGHYSPPALPRAQPAPPVPAEKPAPPLTISAVRGLVSELVESVREVAASRPIPPRAWDFSVARDTHGRISRITATAKE